MNDDSKPISAFDEICHLTIKTMHSMDMDTLLRLRKQATRELDRAKLTKNCIDSALALKQEEHEREVAQDDANQPSLLD
jgi:hypothetical protein